MREALRGPSWLHTAAGTVSIHQRTYIEQVYRKYLNGMTRSMSAPIEPGSDGARKFMALVGTLAGKTDPAMEDKDMQG